MFSDNGAKWNGGSNGGRVWSGENPFAGQVEPIQWQQVSGFRPWTGFGF